MYNPFKKHHIELRYDPEARFTKYTQCDHEWEFACTLTQKCTQCGCYKDEQCRFGQMKHGGLTGGFERIFLTIDDENRFNKYMKECMNKYAKKYKLGEYDNSPHFIEINVGVII